MELPVQAQRTLAELLTSMMCSLQRAPGSLILGHAVYPVQTNTNNFSAAFSENQQPVLYYSSYTQKCFFKLMMSFI